MIKKFSACVICLMAPAIIYAGEVKGPSIAVEEANPAELAIDIPETGDSQNVTVKRRRLETYIIAPVPTLSDVLFAKVDFFQERRFTTTNNIGSTSKTTIDSPSAMGLGLVYLRPKKPNSPQIFGVIERYGYPRLSDREQMLEYVIAADFENEELPFSLKFNNTDKTKSRALIRLRQFPGYQHWLFLLAHKIDTSSGWSFDVSIPNHLTIGWENSDASWKYYGGMKYNGREYPLSHQGKKVWAEGYTTTAFVATRRELHAPLYLALEAGMQKEHLIYRDDREHKLFSFETKYSPWVRVALETWVPR